MVCRNNRIRDLLKQNRYINKSDEVLHKTNLMNTFSTTSTLLTKKLSGGFYNDFLQR